MDTEQLDDILAAAAPAPRRLDTADIRAMMADARAEVRAPRGRRRVATLGSVLALVLVGGASVAAATSDWIWSAGLENPNRSYHYTSPTWGECELRYSGISHANPFVQADVNRVIDEWFGRTDVETLADPLVAQHLARIETEQATSGEDVTDPRMPDLNAWQAHDQALWEVLHDELVARGFGGDVLAGSGSHSQLHCEGEDWGGESGAQ